MSGYFPTRTIGNTCHLMVDIETLATHASAPVLAIGAVLFDPTRMETFQALHERALILHIDPADAVNTCGPVDGGTLKWWFQQDDAAIKRLVSPGAHSVRDALIELWKYSHARVSSTAVLPIPTHIWAKSPDFDCTILQSACKATGVRYPFAFYHQRCVRTAVDLAFPNGDAPRPAGGVKHDARDDAVVQAQLIQACYAALDLSVSGPDITQSVRS